MPENLIKNTIRLFILLLFVCVSMSSRGQVYGRHGLVVSDDAVASSVGIDVLKKGGNAIDASVATAFALAVTHPQAGNIGGGGFLVLMNAQSQVTTIDFREKAPLRAAPDMFLDAQGRLIHQSNHQGLKSVGVPGTVAGLYLAHKKYGRLPWRDLVQPAVDLAENGVPLSWALYQQAQKMASGGHTEFMANYFKTSEGALVQFGEVWKQPALANTLKAIRDHGRDGFYQGKVAKEIVKYMKAHGGIITQKDLDTYEAVERPPIQGTYKGYTIYSMPPPSSGGVALIEMMNLMELARLDTIAFNSTAYVHLVAEVMKRAFADRAEHLGDPDFHPNMPVQKLTSKAFAKKRFENINWHQASVSDSSKFGQIYEGTNTTHLSVIDQAGSAVSLTYTLEHAYGSQMGSPKLGFIFNNEMGDFNPQPDYTDNKGLIGTPPNTIAPGKRMLSSMTPTIVAQAGRPVLVIGGPGGRTIINTVFQAILNVLEYEMSIEKAIENMKIHHQWLPDRIVYEKDLLSPDTRHALESMGHTLVARDHLGRLMGIFCDRVQHIYIGASDSSSPDGGAVGY